MSEEKQSNRSRVLHLLKYLYEFSDEENQKTIAQLIQELSANDLKGNRKRFKGSNPGKKNC